MKYNNCWAAQWIILIISIPIILLMSCTAEEIPEADNVYDFYASHSKYTDPGKYVYLYEDVPADVAEIVKITQGALIHLVQIEKQSLRFSGRQIDQGLACSSVKEILRSISEKDARNLSFKRPVEKRSVGICAHFSWLTCSLLRHHGIPARCRGGFETYFASKKHHDHWICEYWNSYENRWIRIDPEVNEFFVEKLSVPASNLDLPDSVFKSGATVWRECRNGEANPAHFGISGDRWYGGWDFVLNEVVLDFLALNKVELLPWDGNRLSEKGYDQLIETELQLLDRAAGLAEAGSDSFIQLRSLYLKNKNLHK